MPVASGTGSTTLPPGDAEPDAGATRPRRRTVIAPSVLATVAGVAARGVPGVHSLGGDGDPGGGVLGRVRSALPGGVGETEGVEIEVGQVQVAFDLTVVAQYGVPLRPLAGRVRERVIAQVEDLTGYEVTEVNLAVADVFLDEEDQP